MPSYLRIDGITAYPDPAEEGDWIALSIQVTNISSQGVYGNVHGSYNGIPIPRGGDYIVEAGATRMFYRSFYMPGASVTGTIAVAYRYDAGGGAIGYWTDDTEEFTVTLAGGEPPPSDIDGVIESLKVYSTGIAPRSPPLTAVEPGSRLSIKFDAHSGYGSFPSGLYFDATVILDKPESGNQSRYDKSETGPYSKCTLDHFDFKNDWVADEKGVYYATIILRARTSLLQESIEVDRISNLKVFTVTEDPTPPGSDYDGEIRNANIRKCNSNWQSLSGGAAEIPAGNTLEVKFDGRNLCGCYAAMHGWVTVKNPSGVTVFSDYDDYTTIRADGTDHHFKFPQIGCSAQEVTTLGQYTVEIVLKAEHDGVEKEVDRQSYAFNVIEGEEPPDGGASDMNGYIEQVYVDWTNLPGGELPVPITGAPLGENFRVSFHGTIIETVLHTQTTRGYVWLYGPDGSVKYEDLDDVSPTGYFAAPLAGAWYHPFVFPSVPYARPLDEQGEWTYKVRFEDSQGRAIDEKEGVLFASVEEQPGSAWGIIAEMMPLMMIMMMFAMIVPMMKDMVPQGSEKTRVITVPPERRLPPGRE